MLKRWIVNVTMVIVVCLVSIELFSFAATKANLLLFNDTPQIYQSRYSGTAWRTQKELWGSWHKPNAADRHQQQCFDVTYRSNEIGARDRSFNRTKLSSDARYLLIGDSFAEGYGVDFDETAQAQLEKLLPIDVYNFGSDGYFGPVQYYQIYKHLAGDLSTGWNNFILPSCQ